MFDCRVRTFSAIVSGPNVRGETGLRCRPSSSLVPGDHLVGDPTVETGDDLDATRPVLGRDRPLDTRQVAVSHGHEPAAAQRRLAANPVAEPQFALDQRKPHVVGVSVAQQLHGVEPDRVLTFDPQLQHEPVGEVDQVLVVHGAPAHDRRLPVEPTVHIGSRVVPGAGVFPLCRTSRAEISVSGRGQGLPQTLRGWVEMIVVKYEVRHRSSSTVAISRRPCSSSCSTSVGTSSWQPVALFGDVRIHHRADVNPKVASGEHSERVLVNGVRAAVQHSRRRGSCRGGSALARESSPVATTPNSKLHAPCQCRERRHVMRPAPIRVRGYRADLVAVAGWSRRGVGECGLRAGADPEIGGDACA